MLYNYGEASPNSKIGIGIQNVDHTFPGFNQGKLPSFRRIEGFCNIAIGALFPNHFGMDGTYEDHVSWLHSEIDTFYSTTKDDQFADWFARLPVIKHKLIGDATRAWENDPIATDIHEVISSYPGFYAIGIYRLARQLYLDDIPYLPRMMMEYVHSRTGIDIHPGASIGEEFERRM